MHLLSTNPGSATATTVLLYLGLYLSLSACKKNDAATPSPASVSIRVRNASPYAFDAVLVDTSGGENAYGSLGAGQNSDYKSFARAYSYAYLKIAVQGQELVLQPTDYVGEQPLASGRYSYVVSVVEVANKKRLSLRLENP